MSVTQRYYDEFKRAVSLRLTDNCAIPLSGGLDSTLIVKSIVDTNQTHKCKFICMSPDEYAKIVQSKYNIAVHYFEPDMDDFEKHLHDIVSIWEEPFYSVSAGYYLYKEIHKLGLRVSLSGLGSDEIYGGYSYYDTPNYPRGMFEIIDAKNNEDKLKWDKTLLIDHHLRKNDKMGLRFNVEGRYPFLDKNLRQFDKEGFKKALIKDILSDDFSNEFINRKKTGFLAMDWIDNEVIDKHIVELLNKGFEFDLPDNKHRMFYCQLNIWLNLFDRNSKK